MDKFIQKTLKKYKSRPIKIKFKLTYLFKFLKG